MVKGENENNVVLSLTENEVAKDTITVFKRPTVSMSTENRKYALTGDSVTVSVNVTEYDTDKLTPQYSWTGATADTEDNSKAYFKPTEADVHTVTSAVSFMVKGENETSVVLSLTENEVATQIITVYDRPTVTKINPDKNYALAKSKNFNIEAEVANSPGITENYKWYINGILYNTSNTKKIEFNPQTSGIYTIRVDVELSKDNETFTPITSHSEGDENKDIQIIVYTINRVNYNLSSSTDYTYVGHGLKIDAKDITIQQSPQENDNVPKLPYRIDWYNGNNRIKNGTDSLDVSYTFNPKNDDDVTLKAEVVVLSPDENNEVWSDKNFSSEKKINVLPDPNTEVEETEIKDVVQEPDEDPTKIIAYEGQTDGDQPIEFKYSISSPNDKYAWSYTWKLLNESTKQVVSTIDPTDDNNMGANVDISSEGLDPGKYSVKVYAQALNPDENLTSEETWGKPIECTLVNPITIYAAPETPQEVDLHLNKADGDIPHDYAIYVGDTLDASKLFKINSETGYTDDSGKYGWKTKLFIGDIEQEGLTYTPSESDAKQHTLKLLITNEAPTGTWYDPTEGKGIKYTLNVYKYPTCNSSAIDTTLFDKGDDILHVKSGEKVKFQVTPKDGDSKNWNIYSTVSGKNGTNKFETNEINNSIREWTFQEANDTDSSVDSVEYTIGIHISNDIEHLMKNSEIFTDTITKKIVVWKDINSKVNQLKTGNSTTSYDNNTNVWKIETREGDGDIDLVLDLVGGDPSKWVIDDPTIENSGPKGTGMQNENERKYTYKIGGTDLKTNGNEPKTYTYTFIANYNDGMTKGNSKYTYKRTYSIKVWPKPEMSVSVFALTDAYYNLVNFEGDTSNENIIDYGDIACYENDEIVLEVQPTGGDTNGTWKYQKLGGDMTDLLPNKTITITKNNYENFVGTTKFFNYLSGGKEEKEVYSININSITRYSQPEINMGLPDVDNTSDTDWNDAEIKNSSNPVPVDLYGGILPDGSSHVALFDFSPKEKQKDNVTGWTYDWSYATDDGTIIESTKEGPIHGYRASGGDINGNFVNRKLTVHIMNKIPSSGSQANDNVGLDITKNYFVRIWHKAELPDNYILTDNNNPSNNVKQTHSIREGNTMDVKVDKPIAYGYNPNNNNDKSEYKWSGQGVESNQNKSEWNPITMINSDNGNRPGSSTVTYGLTVTNKGPRGTTWAREVYDDCDVTIYNRPVTPSSLVVKGNGTSGTLIITYGGINDNALIGRGDYVLNFGYVDENDAEKVLAQEVRQAEEGNVRFTTGYDKNRMKGAYAYTYWWDGNNLITSGKVSMKQDGKNSSADESFDDSQYNLSQDTKELIKQMTRSGIGDYTTIKAVASDDGPESMTRVYDMSGKIVSTSTDGLAPGIYVLRYRQDGSMKSKKLFIK